VTPLLADVAVWPIYVVFGGMIVAGVFGAAGIAWLGYWLIQRSRRNVAPPSDQPR